MVAYNSNHDTHVLLVRGGGSCLLDDSFKQLATCTTSWTEDDCEHTKPKSRHAKALCRKKSAPISQPIASARHAVKIAMLNVFPNRLGVLIITSELQVSQEFRFMIFGLEVFHSSSSL